MAVGRGLLILKIYILIGMQQTDLFGNIINNKNTSFVVSGYRIYDAEQKRRTIRNDLPSMYPDLPNKKYDVIYADPPWDYGGKLQFDKSEDTGKTLHAFAARRRGKNRKDY
jgi:16S rRNA G966 N2-methylase RsmD